MASSLAGGCSWVEEARDLTVRTRDSHRQSWVRDWALYGSKEHLHRRKAQVNLDDNRRIHQVGREYQREYLSARSLRLILHPDPKEQHRGRHLTEVG